MLPDSSIWMMLKILQQDCSASSRKRMAAAEKTARSKMDKKRPSHRRGMKVGPCPDA